MPVAWFSKKEPHTIAEDSVYAMPAYPSRPTYCRSVATVRRTVPALIRCIKINKTKLMFGSLCSRHISSLVCQGLSCRKSVRLTLLGRKKPQSFDRSFVFALPIFLGRPTYCRGVGTVRWTVPATLSLNT